MPIATAGAESAGANANGLATMNRGATFTVLRAALRGMPWAASGTVSAPLTSREGDKTEQIHATASPKERSRRTDDRRAQHADVNGRRGIRTPDILRVRQAL